ncbi:natural killer cell receptor 2B4-like isoform X2 [Larus michahellis]|uniref:natural killer cell receptor 2B4-like isoform X2 n=1 Tax=Larus michahellis TaxID=119627 RepID=UPI003D9B56AA
MKNGSRGQNSCWFLGWVGEGRAGAQMCNQMGPSATTGRGGEPLAQVAQRSCGCPIPGGVQGQVGWGLGQPGLVGGVPAQERDGLQGPLQANPFHGSMLSDHPCSGQGRGRCVSVGSVWAAPQPSRGGAERREPPSWGWGTRWSSSVGGRRGRAGHCGSELWGSSSGPDHGASPRAAVPRSPLSALGSPECREQAVSAGGELRLLPEKPLQGWIKVVWRVRLDTGLKQWILKAEKDKDAELADGPFSGRALFQWESLSLRISRVSTADSGVYRAEFEDAAGALTVLSFRVWVWEPIPQPRLETRVLQREQNRCNLSLLCTVPGADANVSYSWSCSGDPLGALEHQPRLHLQVLGDTKATVCRCNASNPVSWGTASADLAAACRHTAPGLFDIVPWWAVAVSLLLALLISVAIAVTCYRWRKRREDGLAAPLGDVEPSMTVYEEVGKAQTGQGPPRNETSEAAVGGNTIYAVITKAQGPSRSPEPESSTIYSLIQPSRKSPSLKKKRLDPALVSTAYVEATGGSRHWRPPLQTSAPAPVDHHLS